MDNLIFKNILDNLDLPVSLMNEDGEIYYQNSSFEVLEILNYSDLNAKYNTNFAESEITFNQKKYKLISIPIDSQSQQDFLSTVSHELRTPLTSIRGFADTLIMSSDMLTKEQTIKFLSIIRNQADRLTRLVENLLEVSKISKKQKLIKKEIDIKNFISQLIPVFEKKYPNCTYDILISNKLVSLYTDADLLEQIMTNLIDNASKYSLGNPIIKITFLLENNSIKIKIFDEAEKIETKNFEKIFYKFARIDSPLTRKVDGTGLGLFITKALVSKLNATINVSNYEKGNVFTLTFPLCTIEQRLSSKISGEK